MLRSFENNSIVVSYMVSIALIIISLATFIILIMLERKFKSFYINKSIRFMMFVSFCFFSFLCIMSMNFIFTEFEHIHT